MGMGKLDFSLDNTPDAFVECDPATQSCGFMIEKPCAYLGGHLLVYFVALFNSMVPFLTYWFWARPRFMVEPEGEKPWNKHYIKAWKWAAYGMLASYALQVIMFPFTFYFNNSYSIAYLFSWGIPGWYGGVAVDLAVLALSAMAYKHRDDYAELKTEEIWGFYGAFAAFEVLCGVIAYLYFWDTVIYMLPRTVKKWFDEVGKSYSSGVRFDDM